MNVQTPDTTTPVYEKTRQAWRSIWIGTEFERELRSLDYPRAQQLFSLYMPYLPQDKPILEAGCGPGHIVYYLREPKYKYNVIGFDYAPEALQATHDRLPELPLLVGDVHALPYADESLGAYLSFGVVEHFEHGPAAALREAFRALQPGGTLVLTVPHPQIVETLHQFRQRLIPAKVARAGYYERTYSHHELADHVRSVGFAIDVVAPISHSYTLYGLHRIFRKPGGYYESSTFAEHMAKLIRRVLPWRTAFETLIIAHKANQLKEQLMP